MDNRETDRSAIDKSGFFYGYIIVITAFIIQMAMCGSLSSFGVFFKPLIAEFGWSRGLLSGAFSISALVQGALSIVMGSLNDRLGPRVVMTLCGFLLGLGYILLSLIHAPWQLYLFYVLVIGIGMGGVYAPVMSTIARWFVKRRNVMSGIVTVGGGAGGLLVPPLVNWLIATYQWRTSYVILGVLILVIIIACAQFLKHSPSKMGLEPYGKNQEGEPKLDIVTSGLSLMEAMHTRQFWMTLAMIFCFGFCVFAIQVHLVPYLTDVGISAATAANILGVMGGGLLVGSIAIGAVADKIGNRRAWVIVFILVLVSYTWLLFAKEAWMFYLLVIIMGLGGGGAALTSILVAELFGMRSHGLILGVVTCLGTIGTGAGPFVAGYWFDISGSYQMAFVVSIVLSLIALVLAATLRPINNNLPFTQ